MNKLILTTLAFSSLIFNQATAKTYVSQSEGLKEATAYLDGFLQTVKGKALAEFQGLETGDVVLLTYSTGVELREEEVSENRARADEQFRFGLKNVRFSDDAKKLEKLATYLDLDGSNWKSEISFRYDNAKSTAFEIADSNTGTFYQRGVPHRFEIIAKRSYNDSPVMIGWVILQDDAKLRDGAISRSFSIKNVILFH